MQDVHSRRWQHTALESNDFCTELKASLKEVSVYRSDVVGSLLRPASLKDARERHERGQITPAEFKAIEDRAVDEAVELQQRAGVEVLTDGEMRRYAFFGHLI